MKDRIAIVTGAGSGIGRCTALRLAKKGVRLILNGRNEKALSELKDQIDDRSGNDTCRIVCGDIADEQTSHLCISECTQTWQELPCILIASAGRGLPGTVINSDARQWDDLINTNIKGLMHPLKVFGTSMLGQQSVNRDFVNAPLDIVVIGSSVGRNVSPFNSVYGATKFAVHGLTEALRRQLGPSGIRVTLIEPGLVQTNFQTAAGYNMDWFNEYVKEVGPVLEPDDIAKAIEFAIGLPGNVHLDNISIRPTRQPYP